MQSKNLIKIECAGSGKTWNICNLALSIVSSDIDKRVAIISYTNRGIQAILSEIKKQNNGVLHRRIIIKSLYSFLLNELIKPYQTYIFEINEIKNLDFSNMYGFINKFRIGQKKRYVTSGRNIAANEAAELVTQLNTNSNGQVIKRLEKIYDTVFFDEVQDLSVYDLEIIKLIAGSSINLVCVGDPKQATFKTNNGQKNKNISGANMDLFFNNLKKIYSAQIITNNISRRFNKEVCRFANDVYPSDNLMTTSMTSITPHDGVFLILKSDIPDYYNHYSPQVLRYDKKTDTLGLSSMNFGECKGLTFDRILIFPNKPFLEYIQKGKAFGSPEKYYIAVTRPRFSIAIAVDKFPLKSKFQFNDITISVGSRHISCKKITFN